MPEEAPFVAVIKFSAEEVCEYINSASLRAVSSVTCDKCHDNDGGCGDKPERNSGGSLSEARQSA